MFKIALAAGLFGMTAAAAAEMGHGGPPNGQGGPGGFSSRDRQDSFEPGGRGGDTAFPGRKRTAPRSASIGMFGYAPEPMPPMWQIDAPVLGFGNEALWEDMDPAPSTAGPARR